MNFYSIASLLQDLWSCASSLIIGIISALFLHKRE